MIALPCALKQSRRILAYGPHLEHKACIALVGVVFPHAARFDHKARVVSLLARSELRHRGCKIRYVEPALQAIAEILDAK